MPKRRKLEDKLWDQYLRDDRVRNQTLTSQTLKNKGKLGAWRRWRRESSIEETLPTVARVARDVRRMFAAHIDVRDLQQAGCVGLVQAANAYDPQLGAFAAYAYFRIRGSIIDSQKRRAYREEGAVSLDAMRESRGGWLPPSLEADRGQRVDDVAGHALVRRRLHRVIETLPHAERCVMLAYLKGAALRETAAACGRSPTWVREKLASAREMIWRGVR
jgi:RNA polymerase sigma factor (sigma-70 family)